MRSLGGARSPIPRLSRLASEAVRRDILYAPVPAVGASLVCVDGERMGAPHANLENLETSGSALKVSVGGYYDP